MPMTSKAKEKKKNVPGYGYLRKDGRFQCERCGASYKNYKHLKRHVVHHTGIISFDCEICQRNFLRRDSLRRHMTACTRNNRLSHPKAVATNAATVTDMGQSKDLHTTRAFHPLQQSDHLVPHLLPHAQPVGPPSRVHDSSDLHKVFEGVPATSVENFQWTGLPPGLSTVPWEHQHQMPPSMMYNASYHQIPPSYSSAVDLATLSSASYYDNESTAPTSATTPLVAEHPVEEQTFEWADQYELSRPSLLYES